MQTALLILAGAFVATGVLMCLVRPQYALVAILLFYPIEQLLQGYYTDLILRYNWVTNFGLAIIVVAAATSNFLAGRRPILGWMNTCTVMVLMLFAWVFLSYAWTPAQDSMIYFMGQAWPYYFLYFIFAATLVTSVDDFYKILVPFLVSGTIVAVLILANPKAGFYNDRFTIDLGYVPKFGVLRSNPLALANFGGALALVAALYHPERRGLLNTGLQVTAGLLGMVLALLSGSRGQVIFAGMLVAIFLPMSFPRRNLSTYFATLFGLGLLLLTLYFGYTMALSKYGQARWTAAELASGTRDRAVLAVTLLEAWFASPSGWFIGLGGSSFNTYYQFRPEATPHWYPHNIALEALCEYGAVGISLFLAVFYVAYKNARNLWASIAHDLHNRSGAAALFGLALFELLVSLKQGYLLSPPPVFMFVILIGKIAWREQAAAAALQAEAEERAYYGDEPGGALDEPQWDGAEDQGEGEPRHSPA